MLVAAYQILTAGLCGTRQVEVFHKKIVKENCFVKVFVYFQQKNQRVKKETIIKLCGLFIVLAAASVWAYTDTGEPYVAIVSLLVELFLVAFVYNKERNDEKVVETPSHQNRTNRKVSSKDVKDSLLTGDIIGNTNTQITFQNNSLKKEVKFSDTDISHFYNKVLSAKSIFELEGLRSSIEYYYSINPNSLHEVHPQVRKVYEYITKIILENKDIMLIILLVGYLIRLLLCDIEIIIIKILREILIIQN